MATLGEFWFDDDHTRLSGQYIESDPPSVELHDPTADLSKPRSTAKLLFGHLSGGEPCMTMLAPVLREWRIGGRGFVTTTYSGERVLRGRGWATNSASYAWADATCPWVSSWLRMGPLGFVDVPAETPPVRIRTPEGEIRLGFGTTKRSSRSQAIITSHPRFAFFPDQPMTPSALESTLIAPFARFLGLATDTWNVLGQRRFNLNGNWLTDPSFIPPAEQVPVYATEIPAMDLPPIVSRYFEEFEGRSSRQRAVLLLAAYLSGNSVGFPGAVLLSRAAQLLLGDAAAHPPISQLVERLDAYLEHDHVERAMWELSRRLRQRVLEEIGVPQSALVDPF